MLEQLTDNQHALRNLRGTSKLTEENMAEALKEQAALLADVHFKVAREFVSTVEASCVGQEVLKSVTPGQQVIKIINDELVRLQVKAIPHWKTKNPCALCLLLYLSSGKTTSSANWFAIWRRSETTVCPSRL